MESIERTNFVSAIEVTSNDVRTVNPVKAGIVFAVLIGGWHLCWALLVASGVAQPVINYLFELHFVQPIYLILPFGIGTAALLVLVSSIGAFVFAYLLTAVWNGITRE
jgi:hypothetical protein